MYDRVRHVLTIIRVKLPSSTEKRVEKLRKDSQPRILGGIQVTDLKSGEQDNKGGFV